MLKLLDFLFSSTQTNVFIQLRCSVFFFCGFFYWSCLSLLWCITSGLNYADRLNRLSWRCLCPFTLEQFPSFLSRFLISLHIFWPCQKTQTQQLFLCLGQDQKRHRKEKEGRPVIDAFSHPSLSFPVWNVVLCGTLLQVSSFQCNNRQLRCAWRGEKRKPVAKFLTDKSPRWKQFGMFLCA